MVSEIIESISSFLSDAYNGQSNKYCLTVVLQSQYAERV